MTMHTMIELVRLTNPPLLIIDKKDMDIFEEETNKYITPFNVVGYSNTFIELDHSFFNDVEWIHPHIIFKPDTKTLISYGFNSDLIFKEKHHKKLFNLNNRFKKQRQYRNQIKLLDSL